MSEETRTSILSVIKSPLGFYVLALLIVESFLTIVLTVSNLTTDHKMTGLYMGVGLFVIVTFFVTLLVWHKPENITLDQDKLVELRKFMAQQDKYKGSSEGSEKGAPPITMTQSK